MKIDFEQLKKDISLPDFLITLGWKVVEGSSKSSPKMTNGNQTIVIKKNIKEQYTYWDVHSFNIKGRSVIDLMQQYILDYTGRLPSIREAAEAVLRFQMTQKIISPKESLYDVSNVALTQEEIVALIHQLKSYTGTYLQDRGISKEVLSSPVFSKTFYTREIKNKATTYHNVCVKMVDDTGLKAISQRNEGYKGIIGEKYSSLAFSDHDKTRPIDILFVGESILDCASHYQLKYLNSPLNILYASTEGTLTEGQAKLLIKLLSIQNISKLITIFDNDVNGYKYTAWLHNYLHHKNVNTEKMIEEELKQYVMQLPNTDFSQKKDWNEDINA